MFPSICGRDRSLLLLAGLCAVAFGVVFVPSGWCAEPMSREEFSKIVSRGVPKADVTKKLGKPSAAASKKKEGVTEWTYAGQIIASGSGRREAVTVVIFDAYETVHSVRWADGTVSE